MNKPHHAACLSASFLLALSSALSGCGGGGGSGGTTPPPASPPPPAPPFTVSVASINLAASVAGDEPTGAHFRISVPNPMAHPFGIGVRYTSRGIAVVTRDDQFPQDIDVWVTFFGATQIDPGTYQDTIRVGICADVGCAAFQSGAVEIPVTYTVTVGTLPTISVASSSVEMSRVPWDPFVPPAARLRVTPSAHMRYYLSTTITHSSNAIASATYSQDRADIGDIVVAFKPGAQLAPGVHTDTIHFGACIDQACRYPLVVNPSLITVTYTVSNTISGPQGFTVRQLGQPVTDITWSAARNTMYASIPASSPDYPGSVVELDPVTEEVGGAVAAGFDPMWLALSDDGSRLYVSERLGDSIRRFNTAPLSPDILISLGMDSQSPGTVPLYAADMQVSPGQSETLAVRRLSATSGFSGRGIAIFDNTIQRPVIATIPRPDWGYLTWDPNGTRLYTNFAQLSVDSSGTHHEIDFLSTTGRLRYFNGWIFSDSALIFDPVPPFVLTRFQTMGQGKAATIDATANRIYFASQYSGGSSLSFIEIFDLTTREAIGHVVLPPNAVTSGWGRLVRYGMDGLAFVNADNQLFTVQGPLIPGSAP
jgi:hypothetical protein